MRSGWWMVLPQIFIRGYGRFDRLCGSFAASRLCVENRLAAWEAVRRRPAGWNPCGGFDTKGRMPAGNPFTFDSPERLSWTR
jgi:hypothetical protein